MRLVISSAVIGLGLLLSSGCAPAAGRDTVARTAPDRLPRITALYEQATARPVHPFRKPVRDQQARARRELQAECQRWLADLQAEVTPTALTGTDTPERVVPSADVTALRFSLEQLSSSAGAADTSAMRMAHTQALAAFQRAERDLRPQGSTIR